MYGGNQVTQDKKKIEYSVGDKAWWAKYSRVPVKKTCPICYGKMRVTLILGNGNRVETDCSYCKICAWADSFGYFDDYLKETEEHGE